MNPIKIKINERNVKIQMNELATLKVTVWIYDLKK